MHTRKELLVQTSQLVSFFYSSHFLQKKNKLYVGNGGQIIAFLPPNFPSGALGSN